MRMRSFLVLSTTVSIRTVADWVALSWQFTGQLKRAKAL